MAQTLALASKCIIFLVFELLFIVNFLISENCYNSRTRIYSARTLDCGLLKIFNLGSNTGLSHKIKSVLAYCRLVHPECFLYKIQICPFGQFQIMPSIHCCI